MAGSQRLARDVQNLAQRCASGERGSLRLDQGERDDEHDESRTRVRNKGQAQPDGCQQSARHRGRRRSHPGPSLGLALDSDVLGFSAIRPQRVVDQRGLGAREQAVAKSENDFSSGKLPEAGSQSIGRHTGGHADRAYQQGATPAENVCQIA
jgi:hypothetical protein